MQWAGQAGQVRDAGATTRPREQGSKVLLPLLLGVHGIEDGLSLGLVAAPEVLYLALHLAVEAGHALAQLLVAQVLEKVKVSLDERARLESRRLQVVQGRGWMHHSLRQQRM